MRTSIVSFILAAYLCLNIPADAKTADDYVKFNKGNSKKYKVVIKSGTKPERVTYDSFYCHGKYEINGREIFRYEKKTDSKKRRTTFKYYFIDDLGLFLFGHFYKGVRTVYEEPVCLIKKHIEVGQRWENNFIKSKHDPVNIKEIREIISVSETVETPLGVLENCIKIHSQKWRSDSTSSTDIWYCPGVGHTKVIMDFPDKNLTMESTLQEVISQ